MKSQTRGVIWALILTIVVLSWYLLGATLTLRNAEERLEFYGLPFKWTTISDVKRVYGEPRDKVVGKDGILYWQYPSTGYGRPAASSDLVFIFNSERLIKVFNLDAEGQRDAFDDWREENFDQ